MAKTDMQKIKVLNKIEDWARGVKKDSENMMRTLESEFKEELRDPISEASDVKDSLDMDIDYAASLLIDHIQTVKETIYEQRNNSK